MLIPKVLVQLFLISRNQVRDYAEHLQHYPWIVGLPIIQ